VWCGPQPYIVGQAFQLYQQCGAYVPATACAPAAAIGAWTCGQCAAEMCGPQPYIVGQAFQLYQQCGA
jgi:hypothetical protein